MRIQECSIMNNNIFYILDPGHLLTSNHLTVCRHGVPVTPGFKTRNTFNLSKLADLHHV